MEFITDRVSSDVTAKNSKGKYRHTDLNRVESNTATIANLLTAYGYPVIITTTTDWEEIDIFDTVNGARYVGNINKCIEQFCAVPGVTLPSSLNGLTYIGANNIEHVLQGLDAMIAALNNNFRYASDFHAGDNYGLRNYDI